jgi:hypothetical protein
MVRKTTAVEVEKNTTKNQTKTNTPEDIGINFEKLISDARE